MSWLYSRALVEEYSAATSLDGEQSAPLSGNPTQLAYLPPDKMTAFSRLSRFGMTFKPLTADRGEELLMSYLEDFRAKTLVPQEREQESTESDPGCGHIWQELLARYDPVTSLWKTPQCSLLGDYTEFSETWPRWGLMRDGVLYQRQTLVRPTSETESGLWRTPQVQEGMRGVYKSKEAMDAHLDRGHQLSLSNQVVHRHLWPTPRSCSAMAATITPESAWAENRFPNLETVVGRRLWPTPQASDNRDRGNMSNPAIQRRVEMGKQIMLSQSVDPNSGQLNPTWVEWLMGWPLGWTDLKPLATDKFRSWQQQHGDS
jgi:hypothetical protein